MNVPFIDLGRTTARIKDDVLKEIADVLAKNEFVGGPRVTAVEQKLAAALSVPRVVSCANGTDALVIALKVLGVGPGKKVALPNLTFWATYEAVAQLGATPVLIDVDATDLQLSLAELERAHLLHQVDACVLVHLFGWASSKLADIRAFCTSKGIALLEDGAQCFGVDVAGKPVLAGARASTLSFYPAKVIGGAMDGGAMTFTSPDDEALARSLANHGRATHYSYGHIGWNSRMGGMQAAWLLRMLDELPSLLASRRAAATRMRAALKPHEGKRGLKVYGPPAGVVENGYLNVVTVDDAQKIADALKAKGIGTGRTYPETLADQKPAQAYAQIVVGELAVSRAFCARVLNLPLFAGIRDDEVDAAVAAFVDVLEGR